MYVLAVVSKPHHFQIFQDLLGRTYCIVMHPYIVFMFMLHSFLVRVSPNGIIFICNINSPLIYDSLFALLIAEESVTLISNYFLTN